MTDVSCAAGNVYYDNNLMTYLAEICETTCSETACKLKG